MSSKVVMADLVDGAKKLVDAFQVKEDEEILIVADSKTEPLLIQVISDAVVDRGALVTTVIGQYSTGMWAGTPFRRRREFTKCMENALKTCDGFIGISHCRFLYSFGEWYEYPTRQVMLMIPTTEFLASEASRFPWQVDVELAKKAHEILRPAHGKIVTVTDPLGTDMKFKLDYNTVYPHPDWIRADRPGSYALWPGCPGVPAVTIYAKEAEGTIVWEYQELFDYKIMPPIKVIAENGWATKVEGGYEAKLLQKIFKKYPNANHISEFGFGMNPKLQLTANSWFTGHRAGCVFNALADSWGLSGKIKSSFWENHGLIVKPTVYVGDKLLIDNGELTLLEDPDVREVASKLGYDPDKWLRTEPIYRNWEWTYGMSGM
ncbi:MAG: hypothetical protein ACFFCW_09265 [Candidatus Hodarchaeota archaeon]